MMVMAFQSSPIFSLPRARRVCSEVIFRFMRSPVCACFLLSWTGPGRSDRSRPGPGISEPRVAMIYDTKCGLISQAPRQEKRHAHCPSTAGGCGQRARREIPGRSENHHVLSRIFAGTSGGNSVVHFQSRFVSLMFVAFFIALVVIVSKAWPRRSVI